MLRYATTNEGKMHEATDYLGADSVEQFDYDYTEIQSDDLASIAAHGARDAYTACGEPVITDDAGLFVDALNGFPGPYSSFVEETLGIERVGRLALAEDDTRASFRCVLAYCDGDAFDATPDPVDRSDRNTAAATGPKGTSADVTGPGESDDPIPVKLFEGYVPGRIVEPRGDGGFGYDPIFEHGGTTFAEMDATRKNALSHRGRALAKFAEWFESR